MRNQKIPASTRATIRRLHQAGKGIPEIVEELGLARTSVVRVVRLARAGVVSHLDWQPRPGRLSEAEREEIFAGLRGKETYSAIAARLGRSVSTVSREVNGNGGRRHYRPHRAHRRSFDNARRPKQTALARHQPLADVVAEWLGLLWSPQQIARRLRDTFPDDPMMWVSHETIYQSLYVQGRGELRRELARCLRTGRAHRRPQNRLERRGKIPNMVNISDRPPEVEDRAVPGHWEGDLLMGRNNRTAVGTLVERHTRFVLLLHLPNGHGAEEVRDAMARAISTLPEQLTRTVTWDQGKEMGQHLRFTVDTGIPVYFCDPHSPWQRGSNENTNGLLRQYMPKGTDLSVHTQEDLDAFAASLNGRPRQTLNWMTPSEKLAEVLALTG